MFLDVVEALPSDLQKQADSSDPFIPVGPLPISCLLVSMSSDIFGKTGKNSSNSCEIILKISKSCCGFNNPLSFRPFKSKNIFG